MSPRMSFDPALISETASNLRSAADGIQAHLAQLESEASRLQSAWSGEAMEAYRTAQQKWTAGLRALNGIVADASRAGQASSDRYAAAQSTVEGIWS
ncbi:WXG100 family type VII secretion target [Microbacterium sp. NPDC089180]|uniref:ESAT-6-like protein n=1 Tax=Microbacterium galbum TaxID=3075994 RepID=A0ABU3T6F8_9MICO|nr:WXG100 family type VII secretion target [Microbacterium sp. KSW4-17]MDU0366964.1 WXG100 family type VII secretion target [Microbacterium sp. KSW4-17]